MQLRDRQKGAQSRHRQYFNHIWFRLACHSHCRPPGHYSSRLSGRPAWSMISVARASNTGFMFACSAVCRRALSSTNAAWAAPNSGSSRESYTRGM